MVPRLVPVPCFMDQVRVNEPATPLLLVQEDGLLQQAGHHRAVLILTLQVLVRLGHDVGQVRAEDSMRCGAALEAARPATCVPWRAGLVAGEHAESKRVGDQPVSGHHVPLARDLDDITRQASNQRVVPEPRPKN